MKRKSSLNETTGKTISEFEAFLILAEKLINEKIEAGGKGLILAKGKPNEVKLSYKKALKILKSMDKCFAYKGCKSYGVCMTCNNFDTTKFQDKEFGYCGSDMKHKYDTCPNHSKLGGGFGL